MTMWWICRTYTYILMITISIWNQEIKAAKIARSNFNIELEDLKNILFNISYGGLIPNIIHWDRNLNTIS